MWVGAPMQIPLIHPESRFKIYWEVYLLIMTVAVTIVAPLMVVFQLTMTPLLLAFDILVTISFAIDIVIQFNTGFMVRQEMVTDRKVIAKRYLKGWFFLDLLATLPFTWVFSSSRFAALNRGFPLLPSRETV
jgi:hyperpolarization activated cyclic nucleotide-gated potassium channel 2